MRSALVLVSALMLSACGEVEVSRPEAVSMTEEAVGHYCQMMVIEHEGPKAQVHVKGMEHPLWFSQVRDAIVFLRLPEETDKPTAIYVNDMARAESWADPGRDNWIAAEDALFVIDSTVKGGMGAPEAVPFGSEEAAKKFAASNGGKVVHLADIPDAYVLSPLGAEANAGGEGHTQ